jgi:hypothetical protein
MMTPFLQFDHIGKTFSRGSSVTEVLVDIKMTIDEG